MRSAKLILLLVVPLACGPVINGPKNIVYDDHSFRNRYDVYLPNDNHTQRPAVVFIHGGGWSKGDKGTYGPYLTSLAADGFVAVSVDYRMVPEGGAWPVAAQDARCAYAHVLAHASDYGIDKSRIATFGYSAGGMLASLIALKLNSPEMLGSCPTPGNVPPPRSTISADGVLDMVDLGWTPTIRRFLGGTPDERPDAYQKSSAVENVSAGDPPFLLIQGEQDALVPLHQALKMQRLLEAVGTHVELLSVFGGGHVSNPGVNTGELQFGGTTNSPQAFWAVEPFLRRTLGAP